MLRGFSIFYFFLEGGGGGRGSKTLSLLSKVNSEIHHCFFSASYSPMLIVGKEDEIVTYKLQNNSWTRRSLFPAKDVAGLECAHDERRIYWSDRKEINELSLTATFSDISSFHLDRLKPPPSPNSLAFNWIDFQLYWIDAKDIYLGDLGNWRIVRLIEGKLDIPKAIALSPSDG